MQSPYLDSRPVARVMHLLPHPGQGGERYVEQLRDGLPEYEHAIDTLAPSPSPVKAAPALIFKRPFLAAEAKKAGVVHIHGDMAAMLSRQIVKGSPVVFTTHGLHFVRRATGRRATWARRALREVMRSATATLCTSQAELEELQEIAQGEGRLMLARNAVPPAPAPDPAQRAHVRAELDVADDDVVALFAGELSERKDPLLAIQAANEAEVVLLVAGDGPLRDEVAAKGGRGVRVLGQRDDVPALLAASDLFVLPSAREGLSFAVLEAMAAGLPAVVADGAGNPEAVGDAGIVVPTGDGAALVEALKRLASDPDRRARLGAAARERARTEFAEDRLFATVRDVYDRAIASHGD